MPKLPKISPPKPPLPPSMQAPPKKAGSKNPPLKPHEQAIEGLLHRRSSPEPIVRVAELPVQRLEVDVVQAHAAARSEGHRPDPGVGFQAPEEVVHLLPVRDAGEGGVLAPDEDARHAQDQVQESALPFGEGKARHRQPRKQAPCRTAGTRIIWRKACGLRSSCNADGRPTEQILRPRSVSELACRMRGNGL